MFGKKPAPKEVLRETKKEVAQAARGLDKELVNLEAEEKRLLAEVKQAAKNGDQTTARLLAKHLLRLRDQKAKMLKSRAHIRGISAHAQAAHANIAVASAMQSAGKVMAGVNQQLDPIAASRMAAEFQMQAAKMDHTQEAMGESLDDALDFDGVEFEADELTNQVLDELGVDLTTKMSSVPATRLPAPTAATSQQESQSIDNSELQRRFAALTGR